MVERITTKMIAENIIDQFEDVKITKKAFVEIVGIAFNEIALQLKIGRDVYIKGLGTLKVVTRQAKKGRNPKTGELVNIPAKQTVAFKPSRDLKERLN